MTRRFYGGATTGLIHLFNRRDRRSLSPSHEGRDGGQCQSARGVAARQPGIALESAAIRFVESLIRKVFSVRLRLAPMPRCLASLSHRSLAGAPPKTRPPIQHYVVPNSPAR